MSITTAEFSAAGLPEPKIQVLADLYGDASAKLQAIVLNPQGRTQGSKEFKQARAAQLSQQVDQVLAALRVESGRWIGTQTPAAYQDGIARGLAQAKQAGVRPEGQAAQGSFSRIDHDAVSVLAGDIASDLYKAQGSLGDNAKKALRQTAQLKFGEGDLDKILAGGLIAGEPVDTVKQLRLALQKVHGDVVTFPDKNGDPWSMNVKDYASMVAVTKTREASVAGRHNRLSALGIDLVSVIGAFSPNFCTAFLGMVFSISGKSEKYPALASLPGRKGPPFHPHCTKSTRPFIERLATAEQRRNAGGLDDARALLGQDGTAAQRRYKDLQIQQQVRTTYGKDSPSLSAAELSQRITGMRGVKPIPADQLTPAPTTSVPPPAPVAQPSVQISVVDPAKLAATAQLLGVAASRDAIAATAGAPPGASVRITADTMGGGSIDLKVAQPSTGLKMELSIRRDPAGPYVYVSGVDLDEAHQGQGIGTGVIHRQVKAARAIGVKSVALWAAKAEGVNGFYTWPRLGFDGPLSPLMRERLAGETTLPAEARGAQQVSDLMKTKAGRDWWMANGEAMGMEFTVTPDGSSRSERILEAYVRATQKPE